MAQHAAVPFQYTSVNCGSVWCCRGASLSFSHLGLLGLYGEYSVYNRVGKRMSKQAKMSL